MKIGGNAEKNPDVKPKKLSKTAIRNRKYAKFRRSAKSAETELEKVKRELMEAKDAEAQLREVSERQRKDLENKEKELSGKERRYEEQ